MVDGTAARMQDKPSHAPDPVQAGRTQLTQRFNATSPTGLAVNELTDHVGMAGVTCRLLE
jgi:hypothetical protein